MPETEAWLDIARRRFDQMPDLGAGTAETAANPDDSWVTDEAEQPELGQAAHSSRHDHTHPDRAATARTSPLRLPRRSHRSRRRHSPCRGVVAAAGRPSHATPRAGRVGHARRSGSLRPALPGAAPGSHHLHVGRARHSRGAGRPAGTATHRPAGSRVTYCPRRARPWRAMLVPLRLRRRHRRRTCRNCLVRPPASRLRPPRRPHPLLQRACRRPRQGGRLTGLSKLQPAALDEGPLLPPLRCSPARLTRSTF